MTGDRLRDIIGGSLIGAFVVSLGILFWKAIPETNEQLITYMLGQLSGFVGGVVLFHYGTTAGNQKATENTGKAFDAVKEVAKASAPTDPNAIRDGDQVTVEKKP